MCDLFFYRMEKNYQGDLADIVRATATAAPSTSDLPIPDWQLPAEPLCFPGTADAPFEVFGNPYGFLHDPLLPELPDSTFFEAPDVAVAAGGLVEEMKSTRPCNTFSSGVPTSSPLSPRTVQPMTIIAGSSSCIADDDGVQSSSSRAPGIKRRKGQAKKVVCIPAPAAASSSRPSGEVVPSDLWAWRKYGQKPIKGSPYPRGYYRCSSSKGCSARKQVERSRTDPSMLVITYTSEHNHPWPTQRNALAGSTRSQHPRNSSSASKNSPKGKKSPTNSKDTEEKETLASSRISSIKEEAQEAVEKPMDVMEDGEFNQIFHQSYKPITSESMQSDDFFADLAELDPDPMSLVFSKGMLGDKLHGERENKALDGLNYFDWSNNSF